MAADSDPGQEVMCQAALSRSNRRSSLRRGTWRLRLSERPDRNAISGVDTTIRWNAERNAPPARGTPKISSKIKVETKTIQFHFFITTKTKRKPAA
jgi:hypothetical protein